MCCQSHSESLDNHSRLFSIRDVLQMRRPDDEEKGIMTFNKSIICVEECCASGVGKED